MVRDSLTEREREERRKQAVEVLERGYDPVEVANIFDVSARSIREWKRSYVENGMSGLEGACRNKEYLENVSLDFLFDILSKAEDEDVIKKVVVAINHKQESSITTNEISNRYGLSVETIERWLSLFENINNNTVESSIKKISNNIGNKCIDVEKNKRNKQELAARRKEAIRLLGRGFSIDDISNIFDVHKSSVRHWRRTYEKEGWEGLEATPQPAKGGSNPHLEDVSADYLRKMLKNAENKKSTRILMLALNYKCSTEISQKELSERYGMSEESVANSLYRIEDYKAEENNESVVEPKETDININKNIPKRTKREVDNRKKEALRALNRGVFPDDIAEVLNVEPRTVYRWRKTYNKEGIQGVTSVLNNENLAILQDVSVEYLQSTLQKVDSSRATQKIMVGLSYKQEPYTTREQIAKRYGYSTNTIDTWLNNLNKLKNEPIKKVLYDARGGQTTQKISEIEISRLNSILQSNPEKHGFSGEFWTTKRFFDILTSELNVDITIDTAREYLYEINENINENKYPVFEERECLKQVSGEKLLAKLQEIRDKPTERLMTAILYKEGFSVPRIADWFERDRGTIYRWFDDISSNELDNAIYDDKSGGKQKKLSKKMFPKLEDELSKGAEEHGYLGQIWTGPRMAEVIEEVFDISVCPQTARRYVKQLGWSQQKPQQRFVERDEQGIEEFRNQKWKSIRENAKTENQAIVFVDETKFRLLPTYKTTWAPIGKRPVVKTSGLFNFVAVIGAVVYIPNKKLLNFEWRIQRSNFNTQSITEFLIEIMNNLSNNPIFLLDNLSAHKTAISNLEDNSRNDSFNVKWFPKYSSGLNPVDKVWGQAKYNELANYAPKNLDKLETKVEKTFNDIQTDEKILRYCIKDTGLEIEA